MRLFVALVPPADALDELAAAVDALRATPGLRWTRPEQWHVTLAFLAEVDERTREALTPRLERVAHRHAPPTLALAGGGRFGRQVLWTRVDGDRAAAAQARRCRPGRRPAVRAAGRRAALPPAPHPRPREGPGHRPRAARRGSRRVRGPPVVGV
jgi:2'-5' RNA ligase